MAHWFRQISSTFRNSAEGATHRLLRQAAPLHYRIQDHAKSIAHGEQPVIYSVAYPKGRGFKTAVGTLVLTPTRLIYAAPAIGSTIHSSGSPPEVRETPLTLVEGVELKKGSLFNRFTMLSYADSIVIRISGDEFSYNIIDAEVWVARLEEALRHAS